MAANLKLGLMLGYWGAGPENAIELGVEAERLGFDSVWTAEAYGSDAFTPLAWIGARTSRIKLGTGLAQLSARPPATLAMTAASLDHLSGGRLILGLGVSGPQVVEGWYGQPFARPLARTREYVDTVRAILRRDAAVESGGPHYPLPYEGPGSTGLGKALKLTVHPLRSDIPVYLGAEGPRNVALATEIADGWLPIFYSPYRPEVYAEALAGRPAGFEIACPVTVILSDDVGHALGVIKWYLAFYVGAMGAPTMNFHHDVIARLGFGEEAERARWLFAEGKRAEAAAAIPDELADEISLVGPAHRIRERLQPWIESPVTQLLAGTRDADAMRLVVSLLS